MAPLVARRSQAVLPMVVAALLAVALSGCVASKDDRREDTLQEYQHSAGSASQAATKKFDVAKGTDAVKVVADTRGEEETDCPNGVWNYGDPVPPGWCAPDDDDPAATSGRMVVKLLDPSGRTVETMDLPFASVETRTVKDPAVGEWTLQISYTGGYSGPASVRVTEPVQASGAFLGGSFWDIAGIILTVALLVGGAYLYRRRTRFLARELHRIDHTVKVFGTDVEECRTNLREMQHHLKDLLVKRKIEESHYLILERRIEQYLRDLETPGNRHDATKAPLPRPAKLNPAMAEEEFDLPLES